MPTKSPTKRAGRSPTRANAIPTRRRTGTIESPSMSRSPSPASRSNVSPSSLRKAPVTAEFQDASISHLPKVVIAVWTVVALYSALVMRLSDGVVKAYEMPLYYVAGMFLFYTWHWLAHSKWSGPVHTYHVRHHWKIYPPSSFFGKNVSGIDSNQVYGESTLSSMMPTWDSLPHDGSVFVIGGLFLFLVSFFVTRESIYGGAGGFVIMGLVANSIHQWFHVKGHWLEKYDWFLELRSLHFLHHVGDTKSNLCVINFQVDKLLGRYATSASQTTASGRKSNSQGVTASADRESCPPSCAEPGHLHRAASAGGIVCASLGFPCTLSHKHCGANSGKGTWAYQRGFLAVIARVVITAALLWAWFKTQDMIGTRDEGEANRLNNGAVRDLVHDFLEPMTDVLVADKELTSNLLILTSAMIDVAVIGMVSFAMAGPTMRPVVSMLIAMVMRQACQFICIMPTPLKMQWFYPGFPSILVTYPTANDFFFSGHTATAVVSAIEIYRASPRNFKPIVGAIVGAYACTEAFTVTVLRAHWTLDVFTGAIAGRYATLVSWRIADKIDAWLP